MDVGLNGIPAYVIGISTQLIFSLCLISSMVSLFSPNYASCGRSTENNGAVRK